VQHTAPVFLQLKSRKLDYERNEPMLSARRPKSKIHLLHSSSLILVDLINCEFVTCENSCFRLLTYDVDRICQFSTRHSAITIESERKYGATWHSVEWTAAEAKCQACGAMDVEGLSAAFEYSGQPAKVGGTSSRIATPRTYITASHNKEQ